MARDLIELRRSNWIPRRAQLQATMLPFDMPASCLLYNLQLWSRSVRLHSVRQSCLPCQPEVVGGKLLVILTIGMGTERGILLCYMVEVHWMRIGGCICPLFIGLAAFVSWTSITNRI